MYCPIAYGSMAFWLGKKGIGSDKDHTHKWTGPSAVLQYLHGVEVLGPAWISCL